MFSRPEAIEGWITENGIDFESHKHLMVNAGKLALKWALWLGTLVLPLRLRPRWQMAAWHLPLRRFASRTTIFRRAVDDAPFTGKQLGALKQTTPLLVVNAAELRTGSTFYFTPRESGSWRLGRLVQPDITLAHAVTASAA